VTSAWNQSQLFGSGGADDQDERNRWATPPALFAELNRLHGPFALDCCAEERTAKCAAWLGPGHENPALRDAFVADWDGAIGTSKPRNAWCNPPYGSIAKWLALAAAQVTRGWRVGLLIFARTDTAAWHDVVMQHASLVLLLRGRVRFHRPDGTVGDAAPAPSAFCVFDDMRRSPAFRGWTPPHHTGEKQAATPETPHPTHQGVSLDTPYRP
jgi:site-specific DNA-methyltransferase (adenine-specific)